MDLMGGIRKEARINHTDTAAFARYFKSLGEDTMVVMEACWNWGWLFDLLGTLPGITSVLLAHPAKTRIIADAQIKTDKVDARALATLLRGNLVAPVHAPSPAVRSSKHVLRQRIFIVRNRTMLRNRIHALIDRQRDLERPQFSDMFGKKGIHWMDTLQLPQPDALLLREALDHLRFINTQVKELEVLIQAESQANPTAQRVMSVPGIGLITGSIIATEIDGIARFNHSAKLCAYAGLVPSTHASGGKVYHGKMLCFSNRWLKWAFIEAAWVSIGCSPYFGAIYRSHRARGKQANTAITIVARRMCQIVWHVLQHDRDFSEISPIMTPSPAASNTI
jgi:transposase